MRSILVTLILALLAISPTRALAACEETTILVQLASSARAGEAAFANLDAEGLLTQSTLARTKLLPCVGQVLTTREAAAFHRLMALEAFINADEGRVVREFHAARKLDPGYAFPADVAGDGHPLLALYEKAADAHDGEAQPVYPPEGGWVLVAGVRNAARYAQTPVVIQVFAPSGALLETRYVQSEEALPRWGVNPFGLTAEDIGIQQAPRDPRPWFIAVAATFVASGILYAAAMNAKAKFQNPATLDAQLEGYASRANSLGAVAIASAGAGIICTGFGIGFQVKFGTPKTHKEVVHAP